MSWRDHADLAQEVILDTMAERDADGAPSVVYEPEGGTPRAVRGVYRERWVEQFDQGDPLRAPVSVWQPVLGVKVAELLPDWPLKDGSRFVLNRPSGGDPLDRTVQVRYQVIDRRPDGEGLVELYLRRKD